MGQRLPNRGVLIVKDPIDSYTRMRKENVPGLLGMNVISLCKKLLQQDFGNQYSQEVNEIAEHFKLRELVKACDKNEHCNTIGFIKLCFNLPVRDVENHDRGHVEFIRTGHTDEIYIHDNAYCAETDLNLSTLEDFEMPVDISHLSSCQQQANRENK
ncbi:unnamed protein product [Mytilus coruscus]|uniref:Uncharacterized protein n=1 Tax=Mytilus coruscus TaxID=42192 RepID=A0A6J8DBK5_MYTCO|nr:unnamed protein product [Mytilus coruscus]